MAGKQVEGNFGQEMLIWAWPNHAEIPLEGIPEWKSIQEYPCRVFWPGGVFDMLHWMCVAIQLCSSWRNNLFSVFANVF